MKILTRGKIDEASRLIVEANANLAAAHRIISNAYGSNRASSFIRTAIGYTVDALKHESLMVLPETEKSPKLVRMENASTTDGVRRAKRRTMRLEKLKAADLVRIDWYEKYRSNATVRREPVMPFTVWLAHAIERNGGTPIDVANDSGLCAHASADNGGDGSEVRK